MDVLGWYAWAWADRLRNEIFFRCVLLYLGLDVVYFVTSLHPVVFYKTDSFFQPQLSEGGGGGPIRTMCWKNGGC